MMLQPRIASLGNAAVRSRSANWPRFLAIYAVIHGIWFAAYAFLGKSFASAGVPPFYAGEFLLCLAVACLLASGRISSLLGTPLSGVFVVFLLWQAYCAAPYFQTYGIDTLRDSVIWGYAVFAWVTAALVLRLPSFVRVSVSKYVRFGRVFAVIAPLAWLASSYFRQSLPLVPGTSIPIPFIKGDEYCVHLAGIFALALQNLGLDYRRWILLICADALLALGVRSGLLAFFVAAFFAVALRPKPQRLAVAGVSALTLLAVMASLDLRVVLPGTQREFSLQQLTESMRSVFGDSNRSDLEATKYWRISWWEKIKGYTFDGPYYWTGKGYGINLADADGFQVGTREEPLRSPHSSHLTFLARSGVPGFVLWLALQLTWATLMLKSTFTARSRNSPVWSGVFAWLLVYWLAFMIAAGFDVFLEGPMAGIPFWTVFGFGWGCHTLFKSQLKKSREREAIRWVGAPGEMAYGIR